MPIQLGRVVLRVAGQVLQAQMSLWLAARISEMIEIKRSNITKAGQMQKFNAESIDLSHLRPIRVSYDPKNIHTEAIHVTPENIGKLALEFERELFYDVQGRPFFNFAAERFVPQLFEDEEDFSVSELYVRVTDWLVPLRGELHVFRDLIFRHTFRFQDEASPTLDELAGLRDLNLIRTGEMTGDYTYTKDDQINIDSDDGGPMSGEITGPEGTGILPRHGVE